MRSAWSSSVEFPFAMLCWSRKLHVPASATPFRKLSASSGMKFRDSFEITDPKLLAIAKEREAEKAKEKKDDEEND